MGSHTVNIIGVPYSFGKGSEENNQAPQEIRAAGLHESLQIAKIPFEDNGDVRVENIPIIELPQNHNLKYLSEVVAIVKQVSEKVTKALSSNQTPIVLGGDHSIAIGSLMGVANFDQNVTIIWIDTHGDFHTTETTPSGNLHGTALAVGLGLDPQFSQLLEPGTKFLGKGKAVLFGAQKFDSGEREAIEENISLVDMNFIIRHGIGEAVEELMRKIQTEKVYISLDLDGIDKQYAPGTDMAIDGALTYRELMYLLENLTQRKEVIGMDVVELSPEKDVVGKTAVLAVECITAALGQRVGEYERYMVRI